jgi:O-antigen/teichoic acid export membrane protein
MAVINATLLLILMPRYGINGAALAYFVSVLYIIWMFYYSEKKYFNVPKKTHIILLLKIAVTAVPFYILTHYIFYPAITSMFSLILIGPSCVILFMILYKLFGFVEKEDWNDFKILCKKIKVI